MSKDLVAIIKANLGCVAIIDNDPWSLFKASPDEAPTQSQAAHDKWISENLLADDGDQFSPPLGDGGYGSGNCYGGDILQALALIVGVKIESV